MMATITVCFPRSVCMVKMLKNLLKQAHTKM